MKSLLMSLENAKTRSDGRAIQACMCWASDLVGDHHSNTELICKSLQAAQEATQVDLTNTQLSSAIELRPAQHAKGLFP